MGKVQVPFLLEGVGSSAAQFSRPELKSYLALEEMWGRSIIKGGHGVELKKNKSLSKVVQEGQALPQPGCGKGFSNWARSRHRSAGKDPLLDPLPPEEWRVGSSIFKKVRN